MPAAHDADDDYFSIVQQIILSPSENDYIDQLILMVRDAGDSSKTNTLMRALKQVKDNKAGDIEYICNRNHQDFLDSVDQLEHIRQGTVGLTGDIVKLGQSVEASTDKLAQHKKALVDFRAVQRNIEAASQAIKDCLEVLRSSNRVHELLAENKHYAALRALDELSQVHLREAPRYNIVEIIEQSVPATQRLIADAVKKALINWLSELRDASPFAGEIAMYNTTERRARLKARALNDPAMHGVIVNSAVEAVAEEEQAEDPLNSEHLKLDFSPLFEALYIFEALNEIETFKREYDIIRRQQMESIQPHGTVLKLNDVKNLENLGKVTAPDEQPEISGLQTLLELVVGFACVEKATLERTENLRNQSDVDELWDSICRELVGLVSVALEEVTDPKILLVVHEKITICLQTVESWNYPIITIGALTDLTFSKFVSTADQDLSDKLSELVKQDTYDPIMFATREEHDRDVYDEALQKTFFPLDEDMKKANMHPPYPALSILCGHAFVDFIDYMYSAKDAFGSPDVIEDALKIGLDTVLSNQVCKGLTASLSTASPGRIVQILNTLDFLESSCRRLEGELTARRNATVAAPPVLLKVTPEFGRAKQQARQSISKLVNGKLGVLIEGAHYEWMSSNPLTEASPYMSELTFYLSNIMTSVLSGLDDETKENVWSNAIPCISEPLLAFPLDRQVRYITAQAVKIYAADVDSLVDTVDRAGSHAVRERLGNLEQTKNLMQAAIQDMSGAETEFYDSERSKVRFPLVDRAGGVELLTKISEGLRASRAESQITSPQDTNSATQEKKSSVGLNFSNFSSRFGNLRGSS